MSEIRGHYLFQVRSYECGAAGQATLASVCNYLQEAASLHAESLEFSRSNFAAEGENISWVLTRLRVQMRRYPRWEEKVDVETYPRGGRKIVAWRDFVLRSAESQEILGVATSEWMIINLATRRIVAIPEVVFTIAKDLPASEAVLGLEPFSPRLRFPESAAEKKEAEFTAMNAHIDLNGHVNNVHYIEWMMEPCSAMYPREMEIVFRSETFAGEKVRVMIAAGAAEGETFHRVASVDGHDHILARTLA